MTAEMTTISLASLPSVPLLHILSHLNYRDLVSCGLTCQCLRELSRDDCFWRSHCKTIWNLEICPEGESWRSLFVAWHGDMGRYIDVYRPIRKAWEQIKQVLCTHCLRIYKSLKGGLTEAEIDQIEDDLGYQLPDAMRCAYRIHDGQNLHISAGLMGTMTIHHHFRTEYLLSLKDALRFTEHKKEYGCSLEMNCLLLTLCAFSEVGQTIALSDEFGFDTGHIFYPCKNERQDLDIFITAPSFLQWFTEYAKIVSDDMYLVKEEQIFKFYKEPSCVAVTNHVKCEVRTCFMPELSTIDPPKFFHTYFITLSMSADAPRSSSVQLETRQWYIRDETGYTEQVVGPGVVGQDPVMRPGATFSWTSCTTFPTTYGNMRGYFHMVGIEKDIRVAVECPIFHMKCLPYQTHDQRRQEELLRKKDL